MFNFVCCNVSPLCVSIFVASSAPCVVCARYWYDVIFSGRPTLPRIASSAAKLLFQLFLAPGCLLLQWRLAACVSTKNTSSPQSDCLTFLLHGLCPFHRCSDCTGLIQCEWKRRNSIVPPPVAKWLSLSLRSIFKSQLHSRYSSTQCTVVTSTNARSQSKTRVNPMPLPLPQPMSMPIPMQCQCHLHSLSSSSLKVEKFQPSKSNRLWLTDDDPAQVAMHELIVKGNLLIFILYLNNWFYIYITH